MAGTMLCIKCQQFFKDKNELDTHACGTDEELTKKNKATMETAEELGIEVYKLPNDELVTIYTTKTEAVEQAIETGTISDRRSVMNRTPEEIVVKIKQKLCADTIKAMELARRVDTEKVVNE